jgi:hypothetical protein
VPPPPDKSGAKTEIFLFTIAAQSRLSSTIGEC